MNAKQEHQKVFWYMIRRRNRTQFYGLDALVLIYILGHRRSLFPINGNRQLWWWMDLGGACRNQNIQYINSRVPCCFIV